VLEDVHGHRRLATELARQRPFGTGAVAQDAAKHLRAGGRTGDLVGLGLAIDREEPDAVRVGARDVAFLLDRVAISISCTDAVSKQEPSEASSDSTSGAGLAFTA
jgi:hypothetical protein